MGTSRTLTTFAVGIKGDAPGFTKVAHRRMRTKLDPAAPALAPASQKGEAFETEALAHIDSLYRTALRLTGETADAEDLVQETYLKAFRAAARFERGTNLRAWLFTILHNTSRNRTRDLSRKPVIVDSEAVERALDTSGIDTTPESLLVGQTLDSDLQAAMDRLPAVFREAVWLRDVEEFSYAEIAGMLAVPVGTVMSRISRGRGMLYEALRAKRPLHFER